MDTVVKGDHFDCQLLTIMAYVIDKSLYVVSGRCYLVLFVADVIAMTVGRIMQ